MKVTQNAWDPLSALSVAAAVVQFADFGFRLLKSTRELYKSPSGQKAAHIELSVVSQNLSRLAAFVEAKIEENAGPSAQVFLGLCRECASTNDELQEILSKVEARGSTNVMLAADTAGDIERLANRLASIRQQMNSALLYLLRDEAWGNGINTTKQFSTDVMGLIDKWPVSNQSETDEMVREYAKQTLVNGSRDREKFDYVCKSLYFDSISHREASIPKRHAATLEWVFHDPRASEDDDPLWSSFPQWLVGDSPDIYWITGKPRAGKSTLVKFAAESQVLVARFFAWTAGANVLQKSHAGLLRTVLLEAIRQRPQLAVDIFPARWFLLQSFNGKVKLPALTMDELRIGFPNLLSATGKEVKLALLVDGLDEFDEDHRALVQLLRDANASVGVKICASSRPWNVFRDAFGKNPMLQLERLTREDIKLFVQEKLELSPGYSDFAATSPQEAGKIIGDIVDKSQGVLLRISVISGLLEPSFEEGTGISELQAVVDKLPSEVADLFRYIWDRTSKRFKAEALQNFQLKRVCEEHEIQLYALTLWFGAKEIPVDLDASEVTATYLDGVIKSLERKLMSRTGGLLELISHDGPLKYSKRRVEFMHRTASDWVRHNWGSITSSTDCNFDPCLWIVKGEALSFVLATEPSQGDSILVDRWPTIHINIYEAKYFGSSRTSSSSSFWASQYPFYSGVKGNTPCRDLLQLAAYYPISAYLVLSNSIFGEIWICNSTARLDLLDFLTREKAPRWVDADSIHELVCQTRAMKLKVSRISSAGDPLVAYFTEVIRILESSHGPRSKPAEQGAKSVEHMSKAQKQKWKEEVWQFSIRILGRIPGRRSHLH
ncbi:uncharacterized protein B0T15DRAFT_556009 [Chaetomium strumarium]|uniref:NACHT domain-containing protein n=1 Tax=Chaetomium strumarium TaxID=1170767 RepID=A0AAJ0M1Q7_9PEZI|nr:hypothetical protein B0T15DRAFT_556009 [Chaetomium strumarium]